MSIRKQLTLLMLCVALVPTVIVGTMAYITVSDVSTRKTADQLISTAAKQQQRIDELLRTMQQAAVNLTNKFNLQTTLDQYVNFSDKAARDILLALIVNEKANLPIIRDIRVADSTGKVLASTKLAEEGAQLAAQDYLPPQNRPFTITIRGGGEGSDEYFYTSASVSLRGQPGTSYMAMSFFTKDASDVLRDYTSLGASGETVLAGKNEQGSMLSLLSLRFDPQAALKTELSSLQLTNSFNSNYKILADYRGHQVMIAARPLVYAEWVVATKIDLQEALSPTDQLRNNVLLVIVGSLAIIIMVALAFSRLFSRPILHITEVAQRIGKGDFLARVSLRRKNEMGILADNINHMGQNLKELIADIEAQRNRLQIILNSTTESILAIDHQGVIITANHASSEFTGLPADQLIGKTITDVFIWRRDQQPLTIDYQQPETHQYDELQYTDQTGTTRYASLIVAQASGDQAQTAAQTIITIHDLTMTRELEAMKVDFVSMAAHKLRTPLAQLRGYVELLSFKAKPVLTKETSQYIDQALASVAELNKLINDLLDVTNIERGALALATEKLDLAAAVQQAVDTARPVAAAKQLSLTYARPAQPAFIAGDQRAIREVLGSLLANAIAYTNSGSITVSLAHRSNDYVLDIKDTGIGIPKAARANLFSKFYRVKSGLDSGSNSAGLGLFIAKAVVQGLHGTISFVSQEGAGSTFTVSLPVFQENEDVRTPPKVTRRDQT